MEQPSKLFGQLMLAGYYVWDRQSMRWESHIHSPFYIQSSVETTGGTTVQV